MKKQQTEQEIIEEISNYGAAMLGAVIRINMCLTRLGQAKNAKQGKRRGRPRKGLKHLRLIEGGRS
jgi:hypothetical protein